VSDDIWILGISMTKFGKHPDKDTVDLASEAVMGALADGGVTMRDVGILAAGNLMGGAAPIGQMLQKQIGQTGIPVYNVSNACATGATALRTAIMAVKAGEVDAGLEIERGAAEGRMTLRPAEADEFHIVMVQQVLDTLAHQGRSNAEFVESLRNDWLIARDR
jgi:acetyl-CoA acetyltransferase